ncbi:hypothetical protein SDC9_172462 [bioreactor metagenome]|uniref:Uncharacterized protein n=1 Tax=bioreactor metagenome TaxID=1076179 RepID=A0A645GEE8_9ZZZZ
MLMQSVERRDISQLFTHRELKRMLPVAQSIQLILVIPTGRKKSFMCFPVVR